MKKIFTLLLVVCAGSMLLLSSCNKTPKHLLIVPQGVTGIATIDIKKIGTKSVDFFSADAWNKLMGSDSTFNRIKNSGIDLVNSAYIFGDGPRNGSASYVAISFAIDNAEDFKAFILKEKPGTPINEESGFQIADLSDVQIVFNKDFGVLYGSEGDPAAIRKAALALVATDEKSALVNTNERFKELLAKGSDVGIYLNYERAMDIFKTMSPYSPMPFSTKNMSMLAMINFENGQIATDYLMYTNKEYADKYNKIVRSAVAPELLAAHPGKAMAAASFAMDVKGMVDLLKESKLLNDDMNTNLEMMFGKGITIDFITAMLSGDIVLTLNGMRTKDAMKYDFMTEEMVPSKEPAFDFAVGVGLGNESNAQLLLDSLVGKGMLQLSGDVYSVGESVFIQKRKGSLLISGESMYAKEILAGKAGVLDGRAKELVASNSAALYVNLTNVPSEVLDLMGAEAKSYVTEMPLAGLEMYSPKPEGEVSSGKFLILFKNKEQNALISLQEMMKLSQKYFPAPSSPEEYPADSMMMPEIYDSVAIDTVAMAPEGYEEPME
ncbi:MAG: DUF4836 family protein [Cytophagaceae bacterium]|nr:DUF4836 family protein [Cytophagaceae bacterium]